MLRKIDLVCFVKVFVSPEIQRKRYFFWHIKFSNRIYDSVPRKNAQVFVSLLVNIFRCCSPNNSSYLLSLCSYFFSRSTCCFNISSKVVLKTSIYTLCEPLTEVYYFFFFFSHNCLPKTLQIFLLLNFQRIPLHRENLLLQDLCKLKNTIPHFTKLSSCFHFL